MESGSEAPNVQSEAEQLPSGEINLEELDVDAIRKEIAFADRETLEVLQGQLKARDAELGEQLEPFNEKVLQGVQAEEAERLSLERTKVKRLLETATSQLDILSMPVR